MSTATPAAVPAQFGLIFHCPICGSEVIVIRAGKSEPTPRCCNRYMILKHHRAVGYRCPICGSELVVLREGKGELGPRCCNREMVRRAA